MRTPCRYTFSVLITPLLIAALAQGTGGSLAFGTLLSVGQQQVQGSIAVPPGAQRVTLLTLTLHASCAADIGVSGMTLLHRGMGDARDISAVYLMSGGRRISRGRQVDANGRATLTFPTITVPACGQQIITVLANFSATAATAGEHRFELESPTDVLTSRGEPVQWLSAPSARAARAVWRTIGNRADLSA